MSLNSGSCGRHTARRRLPSLSIKRHNAQSVRVDYPDGSWELLNFNDFVRLDTEQKITLLLADA